MPRTLTRPIATVVVALMAMFGLVACGSSSTSSNTAQSNQSSTSSTGGATTAPSTGTTQPAAATCPTDNTKAFAKTRFLANVGLIIGTFHHWIYKPYKAGDLKGFTHKLKLVKAVLAAAFVYHELKKATENVKASPILCKSLYQPMADLGAKVSSLASGLKSGDFSSITAIESGFGSVTGLLKGGGNKVTETAKGF